MLPDGRRLREGFFHMLSEISVWTVREGASKHFVCISRSFCAFRVHSVFSCASAFRRKRSVLFCSFFCFHCDRAILIRC